MAPTNKQQPKNTGTGTNNAEPSVTPQRAIVLPKIGNGFDSGPTGANGKKRDNQNQQNSAKQTPKATNIGLDLNTRVDLTLSETMTDRIGVYEKIGESMNKGFYQFRGVNKELKSAICRMQQDMMQIVRERDGLTSACRQSMDELAALKTELTTIKDDRYSKIQDEDLRDEVKEKDDEIAKLNEIIRDLKEETGTLTEEVRQLQGTHSECGAREKSDGKLISDLRDLLNKALDDLNALKRENAEKLKSQTQRPTNPQKNTEEADGKRDETVEYAKNESQSKPKEHSNNVKSVWQYQNRARTNARTETEAESAEFPPLNKASSAKTRPERRKELPKELKKTNIVVINRNETTTANNDEIFDRVHRLMKPLDKEVLFDEINLNKSGKIIVRFPKSEHMEKITDTLKSDSWINSNTTFWNLNPSRSIMIKGVPKFVTAEQIENDLRADYSVDGKLQVKLSRPNPNFKFNRCRVTVNEETALRLCKLEKLRLNCKYCKVEPDTRPLQCLNCGEFNHCAYAEGKLVCTKKPRCIKCGGEHAVKDHKPNGQEEERRNASDENSHEVTCSNCKAPGHCSGSRNCPIFRKVSENATRRWLK